MKFIIFHLPELIALFVVVAITLTFVIPEWKKNFNLWQKKR